MFSFGSKLKLLAKIAQPRCKIPSGQERRYLSRPGDEDIKWQWSVRETPCQHCKPYVRPGRLARLLRRGKQAEELTNRHQEVTYHPKIWELDYYSYLLPDCAAKAKQSASKKPPTTSKASGTYSVCPAKDYACAGKKTIVHLKTDADNDLKPNTEKFAFDTDPPFCLNEVCGKVKPPTEDKPGPDNSSFKCLNDFVESKDTDEGKDSKDSKDCKEH